MNGKPYSHWLTRKHEAFECFLHNKYILKCREKDFFLFIPPVFRCRPWNPLCSAVIEVRRRYVSMATSGAHSPKSCHLFWCLQRRIKAGTGSQRERERERDFGVNQRTQPLLLNRVTQLLAD